MRLLCTATATMTAWRIKFCYSPSWLDAQWLYFIESRPHVPQHRVHCTAHTDLHFLPLYVQGPHGEIHSNGVLLFLWENTWLEILNHARLPNVGVSNQDDFEQEVKWIVMFQTWGLHGGGPLSLAEKQEVIAQESHQQCLALRDKRCWLPSRLSEEMEVNTHSQMCQLHLLPGRPG